MERKKNIEKIDLNIENIPVSIFRPKNFSKDTNTIIHYHGWTSNIETFFSFAELFAQRGYQVILPELVNHGIRKKNENQKEYIIFIDSVLSSVYEFEIIGKYLVEKDLINKDKVVISGHSMGGFIANILRAFWDIKSSIIYNGLWDILKFFEKDFSKDEITDLDKAGKEKIDRMIELNPTTNFKLYDKKKILALIGLKDDVISPQNIEIFMDKLKEEDINTEGIRIKYFENAKHDISFEMIREALSYMRKI